MVILMPFDSVSEYNWDACFHHNIDTYTSKLTNSLLSLCDTYIHSKIATIRTSKLAWIHNDIRKAIRHSKQAYDKAKQTNKQ